MVMIRPKVTWDGIDDPESDGLSLSSGWMWMAVKEVERDGRE